MSAILDDEDAHLAAFRWYACPGPLTVYATRVAFPRPGIRQTLSLHREVLKQPPGGPPVDHIDGDGLNCRRANLRVTTDAENNRNLGGPRRNNRFSPYLGVTWSERNQRWLAGIRVNRQRIHLGSFTDIEEANRARLEAEARLWGIQPRRAAAHAQALIGNPHAVSAAQS